MLIRCLTMLTFLCISGCGTSTQGTAEQAGMTYEDDVIRLEITSAKVGGVQYEDEEGALLDPDNDNPLLQIVVRMTNRSTTRRIRADEMTQPAYNAASVDESTSISAVDNFGNDYSQVPAKLFGIRPAGFLDEGTLEPGQVTSRIMLFEPPIDKAEWVEMTLPKAAYKESGSIRLRIPAATFAG